MPILAVFFGIIIRVYHDDHDPPHVHVEYAEHLAVVSIRDGRMIAGKLPPRVARLVEEWRSAHVADLLSAWRHAQAGKTPRRIAPLE